LAQLAPSFFYTRDLDGNFIEVGDEVQAILGHSPQTFVAMGESVLAPDPQSSGGEYWLSRDLRQCPEFHGNVMVFNDAGAVRWLEVLEGSSAGNSDAPAGIEGVARDITVQREREEDLKIRIERFREISESSPIGIFQVDPDDLFIYTNLRWQTITGRTLRETLGRPWWDVICLEDRESVFEIWPRGEQQGDETLIECRIQRPNGELRWVELRSKCFFHDYGKNFFGTIEDITERKKTEEQLAQYAAELKRSNQDLEDFASIASHDLQEPLRKVMAFGSRILENCSAVLDERGRDYLDRMMQATERMQRFIDDLLKYSRISTKANPFESVDLNETVMEVVSDLEIRIKQSGGRVEVAPLPRVTADPLQMRQLFQNLIGNALKFYRPGVPPVVQVKSEEGASGWCRFSVEDNGIGFKEEYLDRIFKPFERLNPRSQYEGSGMGLAICKKIVLRHGGDISAHSVPDRGTQFYFTLPTRV